MARKALVDGLVRYDEAYGWHGTLKSIDISQDWGVPLADVPAYGDIKPWVLAVALDVGDTAMRIGIQPERDKSGAIVADRKTGAVTLDGVKWTGRRPKGLAKPGRHLLCRAGRRPRRRISAAANSGSVGRRYRDGSVHGARARHGRRIFV